MGSFDIDFNGVQIAILIVPFKAKEAEDFLSKSDVELDRLLNAQKRNRASETQLLVNFIYKTISGITIDLGFAQNSMITIDLEPTYEEAIRFISSQYARLINYVGVKIGYLGFEQWFTGIIVENPDVSIGSDTSITLKALGFGYAIMRYRFSNFDLRKALNRRNDIPPEYISVTPREVIKVIANVFRFENVIMPREESLKLPIEVVRKLGGSKKYLDVEMHLSDFEPNGKSGWDFLSEVCRIAGCTFEVYGNKLIIHYYDDLYKSTPEYTFNLYGEIDLQRKIIPMLDFNIETSTLFLGNLHSSDGGQAINVDTGNKQIQTQEPANMGTAGIQGKSKEEELVLAKPFGVKPIGDFYVFDTRFISDDRAYKSTLFGTKLLEEKSQYNEISFSILGVPELKPGNGCNIKIAHTGNSKGPFEGRYLITHLIHEIGSNGYIVKCDAITYLDSSKFVPAPKEPEFKQFPSFKILQVSSKT